MPSPYTFVYWNSENKTVIQWTMRGTRTAVEKIFWRYMGIHKDIEDKLALGVSKIQELSEKK